MVSTRYGNTLAIRKIEFETKLGLQVLLISMSYEAFHVIEAYMNGPKIVLRCSESFPLTLGDSAEQQDETVQYIARWILADAIGDTRSFDAIAAEIPPFDLPQGDD